ncbi:hypothetical protein MJH12_12975, partial [bacterium]|nr:hypothetical protein [bacterium]
MIQDFVQFQVAFTTNLETGNIEFELRLSDDIRALSSETRSTVTQARVDESASGSIGIIPIRIV